MKISLLKACNKRHPERQFIIIFFACHLMKSLKKASYQCLITEITASLICTASVSLQGAQYWHEFHDYAVVFVFYYIQKLKI